MKIVVLISAGAEWRSIRALFPGLEVNRSPFGEWFTVQRNTASSIIYFHGGWGKISAAASAQYVLDNFKPGLLVNLGTCGGFEGRIETGATLLVDRTIVYDIIEQMGDPDEALRAYSTEIDLSWLPGELPGIFQRGLLVSADRDILVEDIPALIQKFDADAADWESGAIAWVANKNRARCLILRGVSDVVGTGGGEAYGNIELFRERTTRVMSQLVKLFDSWLPLISA